MKMKKRIIALLLAVLLAVGLTSCKDVLKGIVHKARSTWTIFVRSCIANTR